MCVEDKAEGCTCLDKACGERLRMCVEDKAEGCTGANFWMRHEERGRGCVLRTRLKGVLVQISG